MRGGARAMAVVALAGAGAALALAACAPPPPFERYLSQGRWSDAASAFDADTSLLENERALFDAAMLFTSPTRGAYAPDKGRDLLRRLLSAFPNSPHRVEASERLALLDSLQRQEQQSSSRARETSARITALVADTLRLHAALDSLTAARSAADRNSARLEDQLRQLRTELERLKEIDLKRKPPLGH